MECLQDTARGYPSHQYRHLLGVAAQNWSALEESMAQLLSHLGGVSTTVAYAIMFATETTRTKRQILRNVANARPYSEGHMIQLGRVLTKVKRLEEARRQHVEPPWLLASLKADLTILTSRSHGVDAELQQFSEQIAAASQEVLGLMKVLPAVQGSPPPS